MLESFYHVERHLGCERFFQNILFFQLGIGLPWSFSMVSVWLLVSIDLFWLAELKLLSIISWPVSGNFNDPPVWRSPILTNKHFMNKSCEEEKRMNIDLLIHCSIAWDASSKVFPLFGVLWLLQWTSGKVFSRSHGNFIGQNRKKLWRTDLPFAYEKHFRQMINEVFFKKKKKEKKKIFLKIKGSKPRG